MELHTHHGDVVLDMEQDFYGQRLVTSSADHTAKVWERDDERGWVSSAELKKHTGAVTAVDWAHPEFGQIIVSCSFDKRSLVWLEQISEKGERTWSVVFDSSESSGSSGALQDVEFGPKQIGLCFAEASLDGYVRVYQSADPSSASQFSLTGKVLVDSTGVSCVSWNTCPLDLPSFVVGTRSGACKIYTYFEKEKAYRETATLDGMKGNILDVAWAPNIGRPNHLIAASCRDKTVRIYSVSASADGVKAQEEACLREANVEMWHAEWNMSGTLLATSGDDGCVRVWGKDLHGKWTQMDVTSETL